MISFEKACQLAYSHFKNISTEYVLTSALEHDLYWIFYGFVSILLKIPFLCFLRLNF